MTEYTKEQLIAHAREEVNHCKWMLEHIPNHSPETLIEHRTKQLALARIALAALTEPKTAPSRKLFTCSACGREGLDEPPESYCDCMEEGAHWVEGVVYTAPAAAPLKGHQIRDLVNQLRDIAMEYHGTQQLRERIARVVHSALVAQPKLFIDGDISPEDADKLVGIMRDLSTPVDPQVAEYESMIAQEDTKRLDWLDAQNARLNEYYGTSYGWKFDANFQRNAMMLNDSNFPVMSVREAIDKAMRDD